MYIKPRIKKESEFHPLMTHADTTARLGYVLLE
jgi:hypothetical protein